MVHVNSYFFRASFGLFLVLASFCNAELDHGDEKAIKEKEKSMDDRREEFVAVYDLDIDPKDLSIIVVNDYFNIDVFLKYKEELKRIFEFERQRKMYRYLCNIPGNHNLEEECPELHTHPLLPGLPHINPFLFEELFYRNLFSFTGECGEEVNEVYASLHPNVQLMFSAQLQTYANDALKYINSAGDRTREIQDRDKREKVQAKIDEAMMGMQKVLRTCEGKMGKTTRELNNFTQQTLGTDRYFHRPLLKDIDDAHKCNVKYDNLRRALTGK